MLGFTGFQQTSQASTVQGSTTAYQQPNNPFTALWRRQNNPGQPQTMDDHSLNRENKFLSHSWPYRGQNDSHSNLQWPPNVTASTFTTWGRLQPWNLPVSITYSRENDPWQSQMKGEAQLQPIRQLRVVFGPNVAKTTQQQHPNQGISAATTHHEG